MIKKIPFMTWPVQCFSWTDWIEMTRAHIFCLYFTLEMRCEIELLCIILFVGTWIKREITVQIASVSDYVVKIRNRELRQHVLINIFHVRSVGWHGWSNLPGWFSFSKWLSSGMWMEFCSTMEEILPSVWKLHFTSNTEYFEVVSQLSSYTSFTKLTYAPKILRTVLEHSRNSVLSKVVSETVCIFRS